MTKLDKALLTADAMNQNSADIFESLSLLASEVRELRTASKERGLEFETMEEVKELLISTEKRAFYLRAALSDIKTIAVEGLKDNRADIEALRKIAAIASEKGKI